jgi:TonB family protein
MAINVGSHLAEQSAARPALRIGGRGQGPSRISSSGGQELRLGGGTYDGGPEKRSYGWGGLIGALVFHIVLFLITFPSLLSAPRQIAQSRGVYVVEQVRFKPPSPAAQNAPPPSKKVKRIPFPDPSPDDPEPIVRESDLPSLLEESDSVGDIFTIPDGPPGTGRSSGPAGDGPLWVDGDVKAPIKVFAPQPRYTEEARKARVQGVVILKAVLDKLGNVSSVEVLKGLPDGLAESAVATVATWKYQPATLDGEPVAVFLNVTISFSLQ